MNYLIDTHTFLWYITNDTRLSQKAKLIIGDTSNKIFISIASIWEIAIKVSQNRLTIIPQPFLPFIKNQLDANDFSILPIQIDVLGIVATLPFHHKDPFDRMIIAQAIYQQMPLINIDEMFNNYPIQQIW